jgi:phospholipid-binding lipoprotein MlaA
MSLLHCSKLRAIALALVVSLGSAGCATSPRDPFEGLNRITFGFNDAIDAALIRPLASGYKEIMPEPIRNGVRNFFSNLGDVINILNNLLQGKWKDALDDTARVTINSTFGVLGFGDVASEAGLPKHNEDFGQTLGVWGFGDGFYLVLPILGPSSLRDTIGRFTLDSRIDPVRYIWDDRIRTRNTMYGARAFVNRVQLLDSGRLVDMAAVDRYEFIREAYFQRRRSLVYDGNPPRDPDEDNGDGPRSDAPAGSPIVAIEPAAPAVRTATLPAPVVSAGGATSGGRADAPVATTSASGAVADAPQAPGPQSSVRESLERRMQRALKSSSL